MNKARFPGKSVNTSNKQQRRSVSFRDLATFSFSGGSSEYKDSRACLIANLPTLKEQFGCDNEFEQEFHGFSPDDSLKSVCTNKKTELSSIVAKLENHSAWNNDTAEQTGFLKNAHSSSKSTVKRKYPFHQIIHENEILKVNIKEDREISDSFLTPTKPKSENVANVHPRPAAKVVRFSLDQDKSSKHHNNGAELAQTVRKLQPLTPSTVEISKTFFQGKEEYMAAAIILVDGHLKQNLENLSQVRGLIQCGICLEICDCELLGPHRKNGAFLCLKCIEFLQQMIKIAKKAEAFTCNLKGSCEISQTVEYCEACFVRSCLLSLDLTDEIYFKMWRAVPPLARNWVPTSPPVVKRHPNRGKVLYVNQENGSIISICPFKNKYATVNKSECNSNLSSTKVNGTSKGKGGVKRLFPNDNTSLSKVTGARVKQVSRRGADRPTRATFGDAIEIKKGNGGKNTAEDLNKKKILLDRLDFEGEMIKVLCPLESFDVEEYGYPVIVPDEYLPPKPLCFICGSAGIKQLIFCSACMQPFHSYCSEDELLMGAFLVEYVKESSDEGKQSKIALNCQCLSTQHSCTSCSSMSRRFRRWKCQRCTICKACGEGAIQSHISGKKNKFLKCSLCNESYHHSCAKKISSCLKPDDSDKWLCQNCLKCTSCGIHLTKSFQNHFRKLSTDDNGNNQERDRLCLECFRRRQKGSFCPICFVCYDDNDWDSKMIECEKCNRWIHSKCEELDDEEYFILSCLPETVAYVCRICSEPSTDIGWRQAIKSELNDGCFKVLDFFHKKAVGMSRKRRALTFENEGSTDNISCYFQPTTVLLEASNVNSHQSFNLVTETKKPFKEIEIEQKVTDIDLLKKFNIKDCFVKLIEMDVTKNIVQQPVDFVLNNTVAFKKNKIGKITPKKQSPGGNSVIENTNSNKTPIIVTPVKFSTPTRIVTSFTAAAKATSPLWSSTAEFRNICLKLLPNYFIELDNYCTTRFEEYFEDAMKQVFPWFEVPGGQQSTITASDPCDTVSFADNEKFMSMIPEQKTGFDNVTDIPITDEELLPEAIVFEDIFWDENSFMDYRECSFCGEIGDFPLNTCGRLLYSGPGEWVHVNCAIWSSEVWEEDSGALQQVEQALTRCKKSYCNYCMKSGASLNCCAGTCRLCYHFLCAIKAGCSLMNDKTLFCPTHESSARGQIQNDMHVTRKVFVDLGGSRKKDTKLLSKNLRIFIGSLRIETLGKLVPISLINMNSSKLLVPVGYKCCRLFQCTLKKNKFHSLTTTLDEEFHKSFINEVVDWNNSFSIVIDHSKRKDLVNFELDKKDAFFDWVKSAPRYIDEFNLEWLPIYSPPVITKSFKQKLVQRNGFKKKINGINTSESVLPSCSPMIYRASIDWKVNDNSQAKKLQVVEIKKEAEKVVFPFGVFSSSIKESPFFDHSSDKQFQTFIKKTGIGHPALRFLVEQLPGIHHVVGKYDFVFHLPYVAAEDIPVAINASGSARTELFRDRKPFDMFGWLRSQHRNAPAPFAMTEETIKNIGLPIAMRFRNLKGRVSKDLIVLSSHIHGRGLFARRDIEMGELLIEYAGEVIRSALCDLREKKYENRGIGCYMFRIDRLTVIDATLKGNAARFINHSCEPNCQASPHKILGKDHILIFALKNIGRGEELTYDYRFEQEADKLPCSCSSKKCRKFMN